MSSARPLHSWMRILAVKAKSRFGASPVLHRVFYLLPNYRPKLVRRRHVVCIEGFPRSSNTFAVGAFVMGNRHLGDWERFVADHTHLPQQIPRAVRLATPCLLVIREPVATLESWLRVHPRLGARTAIRHYIRYYRCVEPLADEIVVADFSQVIENCPRVIERLNAKYGTSFGCLDTTDEDNRKLLFKEIQKRHQNLRQPAELLPIPSAGGAPERGHRLKLEREPSIREARALYERLRAYATD